MENYDFEEITVNLDKTDKLESLLDMYLVEANILTCNIDNGFIQILSTGGESCNIYFLYESNGEKERFLKELGIKVPRSFKFVGGQEVMLAEPNVFEIGFTKSKSNTKKAAIFIAEVFKKLFHVNEIKSFEIEFNGILEPGDRFFDSEFYISEFSDIGIEFTDDVEFSSEEIAVLHKAFDSEIFNELLKSADNVPYPDWLNQYRQYNETTANDKSLIENHNKILVQHTMLLINFLNSNIPSLKPKVDINSSFISISVRGAYYSWKVKVFKELFSLLKSTFSTEQIELVNLARYEDLVKKLEEVLLLVKKRPGITRTEIYKELKVKGRTYGNEITNVLIVNKMLEEVVDVYERLLYLGEEGMTQFYGFKGDDT